ncbi:MAG: hypothetical protein LAT82_05775 [Nanoarchaeota archaeon]|nr:hypothetical protein [Nanoarchaeota archaeon]
MNNLNNSSTVIFDQHLLNNPKIISTIISELTSKIESENNKNSVINSSNNTQVINILEIGGGEGVLTKELLKLKPNSFTCLEIDDKMVDKLKPLFCNSNLNSSSNIYSTNIISPSYSLIHTNAISYLQSLNIHTFKYNILIGNIPYSITQPLYIQLLFLNPKIVLFLQSHKTSRTLLEKETKLSFLLNSIYEIKITQIIKGENFTPPAKTLSSTILLTLKSESDKCEFDKFLTFLTKRYNQQFNNSVVYSLAQLFDVGKKEIKLKLKEENIKLSLEKLNVISNEEFVKRIKEIKKIFFVD